MSRKENLFDDEDDLDEASTSKITAKKSKFDIGEMASRVKPKIEEGEETALM